ncbi:MAG: site-2 protease family protein [Thermoplasmataceae archaeon]
MYRVSHFNKNELVDIVAAVVVLGSAFTIALSADLGRALNGYYTLYYLLPTGFLGAITAFLMHELAHRQVAIRFGGSANFKLWPMGLLLALISSPFGVIFAAPGAVNIYGVENRTHLGLVSLAGPGTNLILGILFITTSGFLTGYAQGITMYVGEINVIMCLFNLIPFPPLDGIKVLRWDVRFYLITVALAILTEFYIVRGLI